MPFPAKLFIQGAGSYVPHTSGQQLLVLFPNQAHGDVMTLPLPTGREICDHYAVVQMEAQSLNPNAPKDLWLTLDVQKHWVTFQAGGNPTAMTNVGTTLAGFVPEMTTIMSKVFGTSNPLPAFTALHGNVLPKGSQVEPRLKGGVYLTAGQVGRAQGYDTPIEFVWNDGTPLPQPYSLTASNVVEVDLGNVDDFALILRPFRGATAAPLPLEPVGGSLEVWIRHFCDLDRPKTPGPSSPGLIDVDFTLGYALRASLSALLGATGHKVPVPRSTSEKGGKPRQCMGELEAATTFSSPF